MPKKKKRIFVFGSNRAGRHGLGAANVAREQYGAVLGVGEGPTGDSYAIPTKGFNMEVLPLYEIEPSCKKFLKYAEENQELEFELTRIGCGLAGYKDEQIAPFFVGAPENVIIPEMWKPYVCLNTGLSDGSSTLDTNEQFDITTRDV